MAKTIKGWKRQGEAFWRAHHEAWKRSDLNQREYCAAERIPLKSFGNWRDKFKAEPQPIQRKLLWRRGVLSHTPGLILSHRRLRPAGRSRRFASCATIRAALFQEVSAGLVLESAIVTLNISPTARPRMVRSPISGSNAAFVVAIRSRSA